MFRHLLCLFGFHGKLWHIFTIKANTKISINNSTESVLIKKPTKILMCPHCGNIVGRKQG